MFALMVLTYVTSSVFNAFQGSPNPFVFVSLPVSGQGSLREALRSQFKAETLSGENAVFCSSCDRKSSTRIQGCITSLPQLLVFHLNRFTVDYDDGGRVVKLNNRFTFPRRLDMRPYTAVGLAERERASGAAVITDSSSLGTGGAEADEDGDGDYELVGALVHRGTAQDGHYYSFIKDRGDCAADGDAHSPGASAPASVSGRVNGSGKWFRFDDANVTPFDTRDLAKEMFGGTVTVIERQNVYPYDVSVERPILNNAFMLFYERRPLRGRVGPVPPPADVSRASAQVQEQTATPGSAAPALCVENGGSEGLTRSRAALLPVLRQIDASNRQSALLSFAFDPALPRFLAAVADDLVATAVTKAGITVNDVAAWQLSANDSLAAYVKAAMSPAPVPAPQSFLRTPVAPPQRLPFVPLLSNLVDARLSAALFVVGSESEVLVRARVADVLEQMRAAVESEAGQAYTLGAPGSSLLHDPGAVYLQSAAARERRRPSPLFRLLAAVFLEVRIYVINGAAMSSLTFLLLLFVQVTMQAKQHDLGSIKIARALVCLMQMQPASARWFLLQVRIAAQTLEALCLRSA